jgi:hypothetical protein
MRVPGFQIFPKNKRQIENLNQNSILARNLELHICDQSNVWDNFWTAIEALHNCNMVEHCHVETVL